MGETLLGIALIAVGVVVWEALSAHPLGRAVQVLITTLFYGLWLSIIPLSLYFVGADIKEALAQNSYGTAIFVTVASLAFVPIFLFAIIPWNYFCRYVWRKVGLKLPQSARLGGGREYYDWERER